MINKMSGMMAYEGIPVHLKEILQKLEFVAMLQRGQKPNFNSHTFAESDSWWDSLCRTFSGENQKNVVLNVEKIIKQAIDSILEYDKLDFQIRLLSALNRAKQGINNLKYTYQKYPQTVSSLKVIVDDVDMLLSKYGHLLPGYSPLGILVSTSSTVGSSPIKIPIKDTSDSDAED